MKVPKILRKLYSKAYVKGKLFITPRGKLYALQSSYEVTFIAKNLINT